MSEVRHISVPVEVRYAETDAMGIVHHANYLVWFELARTRLCQETGTSYADIERSGYRLTVTATRTRYRRAARYGDCVDVVAWIRRLASRGVHFAYEVRRGPELLASGETEHVWIDASGSPCRIPEYLRDPFGRIAGHPDESA